MQPRFLLLSTLLAVLPCACKSSGSNAPPPSEGGPGAAGQAAPTKPGEPSAAEQLADDSARASRQGQQQTFLSTESIKEGDALLDRADLAGALKAYSWAVELDPSNQAARDKLHRVQALMGPSYLEAPASIKDATEQEMVRRAQARLAAEDADKAGDMALKNGEPDKAIEYYRQAEMILRFNPLIAGGTLDERIVAGKLEHAIQTSEDARRQAEAKAREEAEAEKARREMEEKTYRENKVRTLFAQANSAFLNENYEHAEALAGQVLLEDPNNKQAKELQQVAQNLRHEKSSEDTRQAYREQWVRTFEELDTMNVLQTKTLVFDDMKRWAEVSQRLPLEFTKLDTAAAQDKQAVLDRLDAVRFAPSFGTPDGGGSPLADVASFLQSLTGVNFMLSPKVVSELDEEQKSIKLHLPERSVRKVLDIITETHENLRWKVDDGVVKFVTKEEMKGGQVLATYEVRDLIHPIPDFPSREINVAPSGGVQLPEEEKTEREANIVTGDALEQLIKNNVAAGSWDADPQNSLKITPAGEMVVHQTPEVHEQIKKLLADLREATGIMVDIQARFIKVEDNFLEDIGVDFRGLGQPGLGTNAFFNDFGDPSTQTTLGNEIGQGTDLGAFSDNGNSGDTRARVENLYDIGLGDPNVVQGSGGLSFQWTYLNDLQLQLVLRAVSKSERVELVTSPRITVYNTARANLAVLNQVAYVQDFNVEIAQAASIADPIVNVVQDGVVLDVRPVVSADRRFITLELRPTIANLVRPIREVVTTLGSQNSVTIQLPEVEIQKVRTSIPMPDGGTVLLGGMKVSDKQDMHSGVPILNKIPIVSFFFDRKGQYISNRKLLILLKASIVITSEHEPTPAQVHPPGRSTPPSAKTDKP
jgi:type II secretory pathway component GspD/PulD (secretin)